MCLADCGSDFDENADLSASRWASDLPEPSEMACDDDAPACDDAPYLHPPFFDLHESPAGKAYAIMEGGGQAEEDGELYRVGGIVELEQEFLSDEELAERLPLKEQRQIPEPPVGQSKIEPKLQAMMGGAEGSAIEGVILMLVPPAGIDGTLTDDVERAIASGEITTERDYEAVRLQKLAERREKCIAASGPAVEALAELGYEPTSVCEFLPCVIADLPAADIVAGVHRGRPPCCTG